MATKPLAETTRNHIVELKLDRVPVLEIARLAGVNKNTVTKVWRDWCAETTEERRDDLEHRRTEVILRLDHVAARCRRASIESDDIATEVRCLTEERQALRALSAVAGYDAPIKVTGRFETMTEEEARAGLAKLRRA